MISIRNTILEKGRNILNIYFTAGHPTLNSMVEIIPLLVKYGVDIVEVGMPYSDPLADGLTIQKSSSIALKNGQNINNIFKQLEIVRAHTDVPICLMGYYNQVLQFGVERFIHRMKESKIQGLILPDLPIQEFIDHYEQLFNQNGIEISFLITPDTSEERIRILDNKSSGFLYIVSQSSITGKTGNFSTEQIEYFHKINNMGIKSPSLIGFGIHDAHTRAIANKYAHGVIIGSAFVRALEKDGNMEENIAAFMNSIDTILEKSSDL